VFMLNCSFIGCFGVFWIYLCTWVCGRGCLRDIYVSFEILDFL